MREANPRASADMREGSNPRANAAATAEPAQAPREVSARSIE